MFNFEKNDFGWPLTDDEMDDAETWKGYIPRAEVTKKKAVVGGCVGYKAPLDAIITSAKSLEGQFKRLELELMEKKPTDVPGTVTIGGNKSKDFFTYELDVSSYCKDKLNVNTKDKELRIEGEHKAIGKYETIQTVRLVRLPEGINKNSIKCKISPDGSLCITGSGHAPIDESKERSISIEVKKQPVWGKGSWGAGDCWN